MDFKFDAGQSDLKNFLSLIPAIEHGKIKYPSLPSAINNIRVKLNANHPDGVIDHTIVNVPAFHFEFGQMPVDGRLLLKNPVTDPFIDMALKGKLDLKQLTSIFPVKEMTLSGILDADVAAAGKKSSIDKGHYGAFKASGQVAARNFNYASKSVPMPVSIPYAKLVFSPENITLSNLTAKVGKSDFAASGSVNNYLNYFFNKNQALQGTFNVSSNLVDVNELMGPKDPTAKNKAAATTSKLSVFKVPGNLDFTLVAQAGRVLYDTFDITNASGALLVKNKTVTFKEMGMNMLDGRLSMNGSYATTNPGKPKVDIDFGIEKMDIQKAFNAFNTVKLLAPVAKFTKGLCSTKLKFNSYLNQDMMPDYATVNAEGLTNIVKAVIDGFEPLNKLAAALNADKFKKLELNNVITKFKIENGRLNVALFDIKKDGVAMNVKGSNGLDQTMAYDLVLTVPREMLGTKANEAANAMIAKLNNKVGTNVSMSETVKINAALGGTFLKPTLALKYGAGDSKTAAKDVAKKIIDEKKDELKTKAQAKVDTLKAKATKKVEETIADKLNGLFKKRN
ncbi:AsmA-like C-terminal region-containing protein [Pedobacter miscanthi]|uniref:AsmA family protein n=1 Tax=Pedobacter miscanthi TaxID=2259170 RepID=UPI00292FAFB7|nr:AsmA-like C-terminal region-containing protein [Pedobacter miscanthi]